MINSLRRLSINLFSLVAFGCEIKTRVLTHCVRDACLEYIHKMERTTCIVLLCMLSIAIRNNEACGRKSKEDVRIRSDPPPGKRIKSGTIYF